MRLIETPEQEYYVPAATGSHYINIDTGEEVEQAPEGGLVEIEPILEIIPRKGEPQPGELFTYRARGSQPYIYSERGYFVYTGSGSVKATLDLQKYYRCKLELGERKEVEGLEITTKLHRGSLVPLALLQPRTYLDVETGEEQELRVPGLLEPTRLLTTPSPTPTRFKVAPQGKKLFVFSEDNWYSVPEQEFEPPSKMLSRPYVTVKALGKGKIEEVEEIKGDPKEGLFPAYGYIVKNRGGLGYVNLHTRELLASQLHWASVEGLTKVSGPAVAHNTGYCKTPTGIVHVQIPQGWFNLNTGKYYKRKPTKAVYIDPKIESVSGRGTLIPDNVDVQERDAELIPVEDAEFVYYRKHYWHLQDGVYTCISSVNPPSDITEVKEGMLGIANAKYAHGVYFMPTAPD